MPRNILVSALALAGALQAQLATHTVPNAAKTLPGVGANNLPLGTTRGLLQSWYRGDNLPPLALLSSIGWRVEYGLGQMVGGTYRLEVVLANTPTTFATFSSTYAANLGPAPSTFVAMRSINFASSNYVHLDEPSHWVPGDAPFVFQGPHLVVHVDNQTTASPTARRHTVDRFLSQGSFTSNPLSPGLGNCGGSLRPSYTTGGFWTLSLSRAAPNLPVSFLIGGNHSIGGLALPLDLGIAGLPGCRLDVGSWVAAGGTTDSSGIATFRLRYTHTSPEPIALMAQAIHVDPNTAGRIVVTNVTSSVFGMAGYCNEIASRTSFGPVAEFGPATSNDATVVLFR